ncbi:hypothetical protein [Bartonella jaculi]|uniref:hypothetical protein n=1 Tax=Bartonella jaculi TaxID=686226 RepID=UPI0031E9313A
MNQERLFICASVTTAVSFFSSIAEIGNLGMKTLLRLSDAHKAAVESEYKSPFYKLWQTLTKDKPSTHNNKKHFYIQSISVPYQPYKKRLERAENYITQPTAMKRQECLWFRCPSSFYNLNDYNISWRDIFYFVSHICAVKRILICIKSVFRNNKIHRYKKQDFGLCGLILRIYSNTAWYLENPYSIDDSIDKTADQVYCQ